MKRDEIKHIKNVIPINKFIYKLKLIQVYKGSILSV